MGGVVKLFWKVVRRLAMGLLVVTVVGSLFTSGRPDDVPYSAPLVVHTVCSVERDMFDEWLSTGGRAADYERLVLFQACLDRP